MMKITSPLLQDEEVLIRLKMFGMSRIELAVTTQRIIWKAFPFGKKENIIAFSDIAEVKSAFHFWYSIFGGCSCLTITAKDGKKSMFGFSSSDALKNKDTRGLAHGLVGLAKSKLGNESEKTEAQAGAREDLRYMAFMDNRADKDSGLQRDRLIEVLNNAIKGEKWDANSFAKGK